MTQRAIICNIRYLFLETEKKINLTQFSFKRKKPTDLCMVSVRMGFGSFSESLKLLLLNWPI